MIDLSWHRRSIERRLTLLYTLVALVAVALFAGISDWRVAANFRSEHRDFLRAKTAELQLDLDDAHGNPQALVAEIIRETAGSRLREYLARVRVGGRTLGETPGMRALLPVDVFPPLPVGWPSTRPRRHRHDGMEYALTTVRLRAVGRGAAPVVQMALDVTRDAALQTDLRQVLALAFVLLVPLLVLVGRWIAGQGLAPLARISAAARAITPADLSTRLPLTPPWPDELQELVKVFNEMLARIEEAFGRLSRFSADLAHELRTPLGNLSGALEVCLMRPRDAQSYRDAIESGLEECRRLSGLIENLLFMARTEHADQALRPERFVAEQICSWVVTHMAAEAAAQSIRIRIIGQAEVSADPLLFRQAIANLLSNAIRHSPPGGEVRIELRPGADAVEVRVEDDGEGIEAHHLPQLFDRFYQVDAARRRGAGQGTGLGLSIVKAIVDLHQGTVRVASVRGVGTSVSMRFPAPAGA
ncbi:MAG: heavy metal sensor histidine kinase [Steroidobacteraceae bacterium]|nr:heavy metal sensor histidine kinase [Steroidobacteraceae bacterium]